MSLQIAFFGENVKYFREQAGYTQEELAEKLEITPGHYVKIENGTKTPSFKTAINIAAILAVPLDFLLKDDGWRIFEAYSTAKMYQQLLEMPEAELSVINTVINSLYNKFRTNQDK